MAISMRMRWDGVTEEQYDQVRDQVGWERDRPTGGILHEAWFVGEQLNVCDVWESAEAFGAFVEERLMPGVAAVGVSGEPVVVILPAYHWQLEKPLVPGAVVEEDEGPLEAYRALEARVGWRQVPPIGGISHVAAVDGDVVRTVTVWESRADHDAFVADRVAPAAAALGFPTPDEVDPPFHPLHALFDAAGALLSR
jgi:heme-degrading monooxygenase HmoA